MYVLSCLGRVTYNLESVGDDADGHELLSVVAAVHHERVGQTLNDWALGLSEALDGVATGRVGEVDRLADLDVVAGEREKESACVYAVFVYLACVCVGMCANPSSSFSLLHPLPDQVPALEQAHP